MKRKLHLIIFFLSITLWTYNSFGQTISSGGANSLVICGDGTVKACGANSWGEVGDGTTTRRTLPVSVNNLAGIKYVYEGFRSSFAIREDGTIWAWGYNQGILGVGDTMERHTPTQVLNLTDITAISEGDNIDHVLALKSDGTVWAWGDNSQGELGDGTTTNHWTPIQVPGLSGIVAIGAGSFFSTALKSDGTVWAWGWNGWGQLGIGDTLNRLVPTPVVTLLGVVAISSEMGHTLAIKNDGTAWAWGNNQTGELGDGTTVLYRSTPVQVSLLSGVVAVEAGYYFSLAIKNDGTVWGWGSGGAGQLGDSTYTSSNVPVQTHLLNGVVSVSAGYGHSLALRNDGTVWAWGTNTGGELGIGSLSNKSYPVQMHTDCYSPVPGYQYGLLFMVIHIVIQQMIA